MLLDPRFLQMLPCLSRPQEDLRSIEPGNSNCQACEANKATMRAGAMNMAKDCIISAPADKLQSLKDYFNADTFRISKLLPNGFFSTYSK